MSHLEHSMSIRSVLVIVGLLLPVVPAIAAEPADTSPLTRITAPADVQDNFHALQRSCGIWFEHLPVNLASPASPVVSSPQDSEMQVMCAVSQDPVSALWEYGDFGAAYAIGGLVFVAVFLRFLRIMVLGSKPISWPRFARFGRQDMSRDFRS